MACMHLQGEEVHWRRGGPGTLAGAGTWVLVGVPGGARGARHRAGGPLSLSRGGRVGGWYGVWRLS